VPVQTANNPSQLKLPVQTANNPSQLKLPVQTANNPSQLKLPSANLAREGGLSKTRRTRQLQAQ
jgi:hypothetical protein